MTHHTLFISDLHLSPNHPDSLPLFLRFIKEKAPPADALYILGDLFEYWIGDDDPSAFVDTIKKALKQLVTAGIPVFFMHGNRDFLVGKKFAHETGCQILADPTLIKLYGQAILLMHGDTLCTQDVQYLKFRKYARNPWLKTLFASLPLKWRLKIAGHARQRSHQHVSNTQGQIMDVTQESVTEIMQTQNVTLLIHGHTHRPQIHNFMLNNKSATRIVLDAWHTHGNMLRLDATGQYELINFT
jgi:UDP-2,3-diacylglucosamine hydrolase